MIHSWVIGGGGLLGQALQDACLARGDRLFRPTLPMPWLDAAASKIRFATRVSDFLSCAAGAPWEIYWAAGQGGMASTPAEMSHECDLFEGFLDAIDRTSGLDLDRGGVALASSAGALYGAVSDGPISEDSAVCTSTPYGAGKLAQEKRLEKFAATHPALGVLIARISTLYGHGQSRDKRHGLLSHLARAVIRNEPLQIYVPLQTRRDYLAHSDAAAQMLDALGFARRTPQVLTKIIAAEHSASIAEVLAIFRKVARRPARITIARNPLSAHYPLQVRYESCVAPYWPATRRLPLLLGIAQLLRAETRAYAAGTGLWTAAASKPSPQAEVSRL